MGPGHPRLPVRLDRVLLGLVDLVVALRGRLHRAHLRGRTIRQFVLGVIPIPSSLLFLAYGIMGGTAISMYRDGSLGQMDSVNPAQVLFTMVENLPFAEFLPILIMVILAIFFITAADSASVVMGILTTKGSQSPPKPVVVFWGVVMGGIAVVMLLLGGETALQGCSRW